MWEKFEMHILYVDILQVLCWGVRNMKKFQLASVTSPSIEFECGGHVVQSKVIKNTKKNPNFEENIIFFDVVIVLIQRFILTLNSVAIVFPMLTMNCKFTNILFCRMYDLLRVSSIMTCYYNFDARFYILVPQTGKSHETGSVDIFRTHSLCLS